MNFPPLTSELPVLITSSPSTGSTDGTFTPFFLPMVLLPVVIYGELLSTSTFFSEFRFFNWCVLMRVNSEVSFLPPDPKQEVRANAQFCDCSGSHKSSFCRLGNTPSTSIHSHCRTNNSRIYLTMVLATSVKRDNDGCKLPTSCWMATKTLFDCEMKTVGTECHLSLNGWIASIPSSFNNFTFPLLFCFLLIKQNQTQLTWLRAKSLPPNSPRLKTSHLPARTIHQW
jgi:hypothetical protein